MVKFIKDNLPIIKNLDSVSKFIPTEIFIWDSFKMVKNMEMVNSFGLIFQAKILNKINLFNIMMVNGGVVYLMVKECIKELMVILFYYLGDLYTGNFKNGLKHGEGN